MYFEELMNNYQMYLLVFARILGIFVFNPIFSRRNIPRVVRIGATIGLTLVIGMTVVAKQPVVEYDTVPILAIAFIKEGFIGVILGFITQMFLSALVLTGELMDMQAGIGMAKIYDASSGVQMPLFGSLLTYMFIMYFFVTDCHLTYIKIFAVSYDFLPVGFGSINPNIPMIMVTYFGTVLTLAVKLALPFVAAELIIEFCIGILMKAVPQIQVMQVNIQVKLLFGLFILFLIAAPLSEFIDRYMKTMIDSLTGILPIIAGG